MNKVMAFDTSYRVSLVAKDKAGRETLHHIGWVKTDASVKLEKDVKVISPNQGKQTADLLLGAAPELDPDAPTKDFYISTGEPGADKSKFLGYFNTTTPALAPVLMKLWPNLRFTQREDGGPSA